MREQITSTSNSAIRSILPPPIPNLIPEGAPFSDEQRAWLNGFFAAFVSADGFGVTPLSGEQAAALLAPPAGPSADDDDTVSRPAKA